MGTFLSEPLKTAAAAGLLAAAMLSGCAREEPEPDPVVLDQHLKRIIAREEAVYNDAVAEARAREEVREREMSERINNYPTDAERKAARQAPANAAEAVPPSD